VILDEAVEARTKITLFAEKAIADISPFVIDCEGYLVTVKYYLFQLKRRHLFDWCTIALE
jgi:hypothetical protein